MLVTTSSTEAEAKAREIFGTRWEAVEIAKAQELSTLTSERASAIILSLGAVAPWRERPDWSGLVEQQAAFRRSRHR